MLEFISFIPFSPNWTVEEFTSRAFDDAALRSIPPVLPENSCQSPIWG